MLMRKVFRSLHQSGSGSIQWPGAYYRSSQPGLCARRDRTRVTLVVYRGERAYQEDRRVIGSGFPPSGVKMKRETINFYSVSDEYGEFSNFAEYPIVLKKKR